MTTDEGRSRVVRAAIELGTRGTLTLDEYLERHWLLVKIADLEAQRRAARQAHNVEHQRRIENELRGAWQRYLQLEPAA